MNETLILLPGATPDDPVRWALTGEAGILTADTAPTVAALGPVVARMNGLKLVACVLRGECAAMRVLPAPPKAAAQFRAAAGFLLEDELAENLDQVHVATARHESGAGIALAIKKSDIEMWRAAFEDAGIAPDVMTVDYALLPMEPGRAYIYDRPQRILGTVGLKGFSVERPLAEGLVMAILEAEDVQDVVFHGARTVDVGAKEGVTVDWRGQLRLEDMVMLYAQGLQAGVAPNFLQGAYRKRRDWRKSAGRWRRVAMLAAASVAAVFALSVADTTRSLRIAEDLRKETLELHRAAFPEAAAEAPRDFARRILSASANRPAFITLTNAVAESTASTGGVEIDRIRYNAQRGEYFVSLHFADIAQFEALKRALSARGVAASEVGSVRRTGGQYFGELQVNAS
ncbi:MAG: type II secretion system protein GspL [Parvularculaceae bacterium]